MVDAVVVHRSAAARPRW